MISKAWALQIVGKVFRVVCHNPPFVFSLPAAVSDEDSILCETCSTLIAYDVHYLVAQNVNTDLQLSKDT